MAKRIQISRIPKIISTSDPHFCQCFLVLGHWTSGILAVLSILYQNSGLFKASEPCVMGLEDSSRVDNGRPMSPYVVPPQISRLRLPENSSGLSVYQTVMAGSLVYY